MIYYAAESCLTLARRYLPEAPKSLSSMATISRGAIGCSDSKFVTITPNLHLLQQRSSRRSLWTTVPQSNQGLLEQQQTSLLRLIKEGKLETLKTSFHHAQSKQELAPFLGEKLYEESKICTGSLKSKEEMLVLAETYLKFNPGVNVKESLSRVYFELGEIYLNSNPEEAIFYYQLALKNAVTKRKIFIDIHSDFGDAQVLKSYATHVSPHALSDLYVSLGNIHLVEGRSEKAEKYYKKAVHQNNKNLEALTQLGCLIFARVMLHQGGHWIEGAKHLDHAFSLDRVKTAELITDMTLYKFPHLFFRASIKGELAGLRPYEDSDWLVEYGMSSRERNKLAKTDSETIRGFFDKAQGILKTIHSEIKETKLRSLLTAEILSKVIAFCDLKEGQIIMLPSIYPDEQLLSYKVNKVLILHGNIPAYGLTCSGHPDILLYRGTAPMLSQKGGIASIEADFDSQGVAKRLYDASSHTIAGWLRDRKQVRGIGYSLGSAITHITIANNPGVFTRDASNPSITFNGPGIDLSTAEEWKRIKNQPLMEHYIVAGDLVSRCGSELIGKVYEVNPGMKSGPRQHFDLVFTQRSWRVHEVDLEKENKSHLRYYASGIIASGYGKPIYQFLNTNPYIQALKLYNNLASDPAAVEVVSHVGAFLGRQATKLKEACIEIGLNMIRDKVGQLRR